jgi:hypothetical protein
MVPFDIYRAEVPWGGQTYARPWLIVELRPNGKVGCFPIASECYGNRCFFIDQAHEDFRHTGLTKSCYALIGCLIDIDAARFRAGTRKGCMCNNMLGIFRFTANV